MKMWRSLRQLWRHRSFRRLWWLRIASQGGDAALLAGMASHILFSPQQQPDAASIAAMAAVTLLPFSVVGPFVSVVLDRVSRRQVAVVVDVVRAAVAVTVAVVLVTLPRGGATTGLFFALLLVAMSLNRFLLAGLSASLPHTIEPREYLTANTVMPMVGPLGAALGGVAIGARVAASAAGAPTAVADAAVFAVAALCFVVSVLLALGFSRDDLGPDADDRSRAASARGVVAGLAASLAHLRERWPAGLALSVIGVQRICLGLVQVGAILVFRNRIDVGNVAAALADIGGWALATVIGFLVATVITPGLSARWGVRVTIVAVLLTAAAVQAFPGSWFERIPLLVAALGLGLTGQALKINVDTVVHAHVDDAHKGRVFTVYDMVFNLANVAAAVIAMLVLPADGASLTVFLTVAGLFAATALGFAAATRGHGPAFNRGTESVADA